MPFPYLVAEISVVTMAVRLVLSLGIVLAMIAALAWVAKRPKGLGLGLGAKGAITIRGREQLGRASTIALVQVGTRTILVGANEHTIEVLAEGDDLVPAEAIESADDRTSPIAGPDGPVSPGMNLIEMVREWSIRRP